MSFQCLAEFVGRKPPHEISHVVFSIINNSIRRPTTNRLISSAYNLIGMLGTPFSIPLTYRPTRNSSGPKTLLCGTPQLILSVLECTPLIYTNF